MQILHPVQSGDHWSRPRLHIGRHTGQRLLTGIPGGTHYPAPYPHGSQVGGRRVVWGDRHVGLPHH